MAEGAQRAASKIANRSSLAIAALASKDLGLRRFVRTGCIGVEVVALI